MSQGSHWDGGVMVRAAFNEKGQSQSITGQINFVSNLKVLKEFLLPFITLLEEYIIFHKNNAPVQ